MKIHKKETKALDVKIERVQINKLFDHINYDFQINTSNFVSILTAPNGYGKTTIFKMLKFILNPNIKIFNEIKHITFEEFKCDLTNGYVLSVLPSNKKPNWGKNIPKGCELKSLDFEISTNDKSKKSQPPSSNQFNIPFLVRIKDLRKKELNIDSIDGYFDIEEEEEVVDLKLKEIFREINERLEKIECNVNVDFIDANRLQKFNQLEDEEDFRSKQIMRVRFPRRYMNMNREMFDYLKIANKEMREKIRKMINDYNELSEKAKRNLPTEYLHSEKDSKDDDFDDFEKRWNAYHGELKKFCDLGILDTSIAESIIPPESLKDSFGQESKFLSTYLDVFEKTLEPLKTGYEELKLFSDIFNERNKLTNKEIKFTSNGIMILSNGREIDSDYLSSGEKNDFVMFYRLIFDTCKNGIVFVDEPEISLHIAWQEEYLNYLIKICKMNNLQAIVATHSPNIVNNHYNLFIDNEA